MTPNKIALTASILLTLIGLVVCGPTFELLSWGNNNNLYLFYTVFVAVSLAVWFLIVRVLLHFKKKDEEQTKDKSC